MRLLDFAYEFCLMGFDFTVMIYWKVHIAWHNLLFNSEKQRMKLKKNDLLCN